MSKFSEHLEKCIMNSGMTENQLAKISGFNRSYIALMKNGQRVSPDGNRMTRFFDCLNLSPYEYDELWKEYIRARVGDDIYERNQAVVELLECFDTISYTSIKSFYSHEIPDVHVIDNRMDLEYFIRAILEKEAQEKKGHIRMLMQEDLEILQKLFPSLCRDHRNLQVDHIVCLENCTGMETQKGQIYNLKLMRGLIPTVIFGNNTNYNIYYYYDKVDSHFSATSLMPYLILTSEYAICINAELDKAVIHKEKEVLHLYERIFEESRKKCRLFLQQMESEMDFFVDYEQKDEKETTYSIAQQPCFGILGLSDLVEKYFALNNRRVMYLLKDMLHRNGETFREGDTTYISYCTKEGLRRFAFEGIIDELPRSVYHAIEPEDRIIILQKLLELIEDGRYEIYLIDEDIHISPQLYITSYSFSDTSFVYQGDDERVKFQLNERSLKKTVYEFLEDLRKSMQTDEVAKAEIFLQKLKNDLS